MEGRLYFFILLMEYCGIGADYVIRFEYMFDK